MTTPAPRDAPQGGAQDALAAGIEHYRAGRFQEAVESLERAKAAHKGSLRTHAYLGAAYYALRRYHEAAAEFREAAALRGDDPRLLFDLGNACLACGLLTQARDAFAAALRADPNYTPPLAPLASLERLLSGQPDSSG
jgi:tetratricopeptide (TPR) repeat protein